APHDVPPPGDGRLRAPGPGGALPRDDRRTARRVRRGLPAAHAGAALRARPPAAHDVHAHARGRPRHVRYIALLRGINVGGKTLIKMADLKAAVEALDLDDVSTYIASGNLLFASDDKDAAALEQRLEAAIEARFE